MNASFYPAVKFLCWMAAGVLAGLILVPGIADYLVWILPVAVVVLLIAFFRAWYSLVFAAGAGCAGLWLACAAMASAVPETRKVLPELQAFVEGRVERVIRRDSSILRLVLHGSIDTPALPRLRDTKICLSIAGASGPAGRHIGVGSLLAGSSRVRLPRRARLESDFNEWQYYRAHDVSWLAFARSRDIFLRGRQEGIGTEAERWSRGIRTMFTGLLPAESAALATALITGDRSLLPAQLRREFSLTGTAHVLAVSGMHVGIIAVIILTPLGFVRSRRLKWSLFVLALSLFVLLSGMQSATLRAACMAALLMLAWVLQREVSLLNVVALAVVALLIMQPALLFSVGFQMSAASLVGIAVFYEPVEAAVKKVLTSDAFLPRKIRQALALTLSVSICIGPITAWYFSVYSIISPLSNLAVVPLVLLGMLMSICTLATAWIPAIADLYATSAHAAFETATAINAYAAELPWAAVEGAAAVPLALCVSLVLVYLPGASGWRQFCFRSAVLAPLALVLFSAIRYTPPEPMLEVIPRRQLGAAIVRLDSAADFVILQDRRPDYIPVGDAGLERFLVRSGRKLIVSASGPVSLTIAGRLPARHLNAVIASSLTFKSRKMWQALDTLESQGVRVLNADKFYRKRSAFTVASRSGRSVEWDARRAEVSVSLGERKQTFNIARIQERIRLD